MSDGIQNLVGTKKITREFNGKSYSFSVRVLDDHAEKEAYILALKPNPFTILDKLPPETSARTREIVEARAVAEAMRPAFVSRREEAEFDNSLHGLAWGLWRALRDNHEEFGLLPDGKTSAFVNPAGKAYGITPAEGVQKLLELIEDVGSSLHSHLIDIRDGMDSPPELKN